MIKIQASSLDWI